jgi:3-oxoacyl-[acyl-carrier protein] reductase
MEKAKNAIITGAGRNKGIAAEICRALARKGINIYFTSCESYDNSIRNFDNSDYNKTLEECRSFGIKAFFQCFDLTKTVDIKNLFQNANEKLGNIDILVNCACYHTFDALEDISDFTLDTNVNINTKVPLLLCKEFYRCNSGNGGSIVLFSSTQNLEALTTEISYAISKASVPVIVSTLAPIMAIKGITINAVNPGTTEIDDKNDRKINVCQQDNMFGRLGLPEDAANLVSFLVSNEGKWITGQTINSEGGLFRGMLKTKK